MRTLPLITLAISSLAGGCARWIDWHAPGAERAPDSRPDRTRDGAFPELGATDSRREAPPTIAITASRVVTYVGQTATITYSGGVPPFVLGRAPGPSGIATGCSGAAPSPGNCVLKGVKPGLVAVTIVDSQGASAAVEIVVRNGPTMLQGLGIWLAADELRLPDGAPVTTWPDLSDNGGHAFAKHPSWPAPVFTAKTIGGRPAVRFGASGTILTAKVDPAAGVFSSPPVLTIAVLGRCLTTAQMTVLGWGDPADNYPGLRLAAWQLAANLGWDLTAYDGVPSYGGTGTYNRVHAPSMTTAPGQLIALAGPQQLQLFRDGTSVGSAKGTFALNPAHVTMWLGGQHNGFNWLDGELAEVVVYTRPLGDSERAALEGYLAHKWGVTAALPAAHPYRSAPP